VLKYFNKEKRKKIGWAGAGRGCRANLVGSSNVTDGFASEEILEKAAT